MRTGILLGCVGLLCGCLPEVTTNDGKGVVEYDAFAQGTVAFPDDDTREDPKGFGEVSPKLGFQAGERVEYYDFGEVRLDKDDKPIIQPMFVFYDAAGKLLTAAEQTDAGYKLAGQFPVVDVVADREGYSPLWEIVKVTVPQGFTLGSVQSRVAAEKLPHENTGTVVNCPIVDPTDTLVDGLTARDAVYGRLPLWFRGLEAFCLLVDNGYTALEHPTSKGSKRLTTDLAIQDVYVPSYAFELTDPLDDRSSLSDIPVQNALILSAAPGSANYSPLGRVHIVKVASDYSLGNLWSVEDVTEYEAQQAKAGNQGVVYLRKQAPVVNLAVRGTVPSCTTNEDCVVEGLKSGLTCNLELSPKRLAEAARRGYCDPPPVGYGERCGASIARCNPFGGPKPPKGSKNTLQDLVCVGLRIREERFCYNACDPTQEDTDDAEDRDSRCGSLRDVECYGLSRRTKPNGVCFKQCDTAAGPAAVAQCANPTADTDPPPAPADILCGNGKLDFGEACDLSIESVDPSACNAHCSVPKADAKEKHPLICTNAGINICVFPDERAKEP
jgi:hypothetical protein